MEFNLAQVHEAVAAVIPDRECIVWGDRRLTFAQVTERTRRLANHLLSTGLTVHAERDALQGHESGQAHLACYLHNGNEYLEAMLGSYKARVAPFNVNYRYVAEELRYLLNDAGARAIVFHSAFADQLAAVLPDLPQLEVLLQVADASGGGLLPGAVWYEDALAAASPERPDVTWSPDDLYILYTGGTTGMPKGVMWRHEDVWRTLGGGIDFVTGERITDEYQLSRIAGEAVPPTGLVLAPLMHGAAQWGTLGGLFKGITNVLLPRFDPHLVWQAVERYGIAVITITGDAMARPLIDALKEQSYDTSSLVAISSTAAVFSPVVKDQLFELLPNLFISEAVGSSEGGFNGMRLVEKGNTAPPADDGREGGGGLINVPLGPDSKIIGANDKPVKPGEIGRLARGGNVPIGYYKDPVKTAATFIEVEGERHSVPGDFARLELDGTMTLLGRGSQCINSGGEKIYPEEIESALKAHPKVFDALVLGVDDERWGQKVAAVVQPREGHTVTLDELVEFCHTKLARYKAPRELHVVDEMPRQPSGKPDYKRARQVIEMEDAP